MNAYPNPLLRFATQSRRSSSTSTPVLSAEPLPRPPVEEGQAKDVPPVPESQGGRLSLARTAVSHRAYPLSTVVIIALIAFLMGSFLRSLLSPADFIYVVSDRKDLEEMNAGWREVRRLLEVKYIVGGWDFQVAVVRRH